MSSGGLVVSGFARERGGNETTKEAAQMKDLVLRLANGVIHMHDCKTCGGSGRVEVTPSGNSNDPRPARIGRCPDCSGEGEIAEEGCDCSLCETVREEVEAHG